MNKQEFLNKLEKAVKVAQMRGKIQECESKKMSISSIKEWLVNTLQEQFIANVPEVLERDSTFRIESEWIEILINEEGFNIGPDGSFCFQNYGEFLSFINEIKEKMSTMVRRKVNYDQKTKGNKLLTKFYFWY